jgi:hypothetical protein
VEKIDVFEVERELCRLPEVNAARIVEDDIGRPVEVHILASRAKHPKQIVRDVQSVAMASFGLDLDRRVVSVVQLEGGSGDEAVVGLPVGTSRVLIGDIAVERKGVRAMVEVELRHDDVSIVGRVEGSVATSARHRLVADATLDALRRLVPAADAVDVETASVMRVGQRDVAVTTVVFVLPPAEDIGAGSAVVRDAGETGEAHAVARAVLDATNRRLPKL